MRQPGAMSVVMTTSTGTGGGTSVRRKGRSARTTERRNMDAPEPPQGNRIRMWRVTPQTERANRASCTRCRETFAAGDLRLQGVRDNEIASGNRNMGRYFHPHCVDAMLPAARTISGFDMLSDDHRQVLLKAVQNNHTELRGSKRPRHRGPYVAPVLPLSQVDTSTHASPPPDEPPG